MEAETTQPRINQSEIVKDQIISSVNKFLALAGTHDPIERLTRLTILFTETEQKRMKHKMFLSDMFGLQTLIAFIAELSDLKSIREFHLRKEGKL